MKRGVRPEWRLGWGLLIINQKINILFCLGICCSHYFKHLDNLHKKILINLSLLCGVLKSHKCNTSFSREIVHVLKAVAIVTSEHLNLSTNFAPSQLLGAD